MVLTDVWCCCQMGLPIVQAITHTSGLTDTLPSRNYWCWQLVTYQFESRRINTTWFGKQIYLMLGNFIYHRGFRECSEMTEQDVLQLRKNSSAAAELCCES